MICLWNMFQTWSLHVYAFTICISFMEMNLICNRKKNIKNNGSSKICNFWAIEKCGYFSLYNWGFASMKEVQDLQQINSCKSYDDDEGSLISYFILMMLYFFISPYIFKYEFSINIWNKLCDLMMKFYQRYCDHKKSSPDVKKLSSTKYGHSIKIWYATSCLILKA